MAAATVAARYTARVAAHVVPCAPLRGAHTLPLRPAAAARAALFADVQDAPRARTRRKVTVVGAGQVGLAAAYAIVNQVRLGRA
jgi:NADPH-dependent 2,4-dienoyl-CoA reductase/sulfur reductase-like enzyme